MVMEVLQNDVVRLRLHLEHSAELCVCFLMSVCMYVHARTSIINGTYCSARVSMYCQMHALLKYFIQLLIVETTLKSLNCSGVSSEGIVLSTTQQQHLCRLVQLNELNLQINVIKLNFEAGSALRGI